MLVFISMTGIIVIIAENQCIRDRLSLIGEHQFLEFGIVIRIASIKKTENN